jgi:long-subunit acyl-CoA synthetase (AMP-forming)
VSYGSPIVVVDPEKTTVERSKMILQDAGVCLVLIDNSVVDKFEILANDFKLVTLGEAHECVASECLDVAPRNRDSVFGYFYTSGTTGLPKVSNMREQSSFTHPSCLNENDLTLSQLFRVLSSRMEMS